MAHRIRRPHGPCRHFGVLQRTWVAQAGSMTYPKGPRTPKIEFKGPNTIPFVVFGPQNPIIWVLGPSGMVALGPLQQARVYIYMGANKSPQHPSVILPLRAENEKRNNAELRIALNLQEKNSSRFQE